MIRTLAEVRTDRLTITITENDDPARRLYTAAVVGDLQASEAELVSAPLRRDLKVATDTLAVRENQVTLLKAQVAELEAELERYELVAFKERVADEIDQEADRLRSKIRELAAELEKRPTFGALRDAINGKDMALGELHTVRAERDRYKEGASLALNERNELRRTLNKAREILTDSDVRQAQRMDASPRGAVMSDAISNALRVLDKA